MNIIERARLFQRAAHGAKGQVRKFSGIPYHTHPEAVEEILCRHANGVTTAMRVAALLHDVLEDTDVSAGLLVEEFGHEPTGFVLGLTNWKPKPNTLGMTFNRAARHKLNVRRLKGQPNRVKTIKLADCLHNLPDIIENDPKHAKVYVPEKRILLDEALVGGDGELWSMVDDIIHSYYAKNRLTATI